MKNTKLSMKFPAMLITVLAMAGISTSCMTTYDAYGRPVSSVDPGAAVAGAAAIGLLAYAAGNDNGHEHYRHRYYDRPYYGGGGGYYGGGYHCR